MNEFYFFSHIAVFLHEYTARNHFQKFSLALALAMIGIAALLGKIHIKLKM